MIFEFNINLGTLLFSTLSLTAFYSSTFRSIYFLPLWLLRFNNVKDNRFYWVLAGKEVLNAILKLFCYFYFLTSLLSYRNLLIPCFLPPKDPKDPILLPDKSSYKFTLVCGQLPGDLNPFLSS